MKTWTIPTAVAGEFAANEYVSACTFTISCDVDMQGFTQFAIDLGKDYPICDSAGGTAGYVRQTTYKRCNEPYHTVSTNGEFVPVTFTHGQKDGKLTYLEEPIQAYFWAMYCDCDSHGEPHITQGHVTMDNTMSEASKS